MYAINQGVSAEPLKENRSAKSSCSKFKQKNIPVFVDIGLHVTETCIFYFEKGSGREKVYEGFGIPECCFM